MSLPFCEHCVSGHALPGEPKGVTLPDGSYYSPAVTTEETTRPKRAIVYLTDVFGLSLKNSRLLADKFAERLGCDAYVPDLFEGAPIVNESNMIQVPETPGKTTIWDTLRMVIFFLIPALPRIIRHRHSVVDPRLDNFLKKIKQDKGYDKIGAVGYCFGGSAAIRLGSRGLVDSLVICHPGRTTPAEIKAINIPSAWVLADEDRFFGPEKRKEAEAIFAARKGKDNYVDYEFVDYKGTVHGFAARPNFGIPEVKAAFEKAFEQSVGWFSKTLV